MRERTAAAMMLSLAFVGAVFAADPPMNVVMILADDLGWSDTTLYGTTSLYKTPNLERLAKQGVTFSRAYSASPLCSPTRATILTGQTAARTGLTAPTCHMPRVLLRAQTMKSAPAGDKAVQLDSVSRLDTAYPTLGKLVKGAGYATGHFGKWHLGDPPHSPLEHGFDVDIPHHPGPGPAGSFIAPWLFKHIKENKPGEHIEDRMAEEAVTWMRSVAPKGPFYMNYWQFSVHAPFDAKQETIDAYRPAIDLAAPQRSPTYAAMVHSLDDAVGALLDEIDRLKIADRTIIIFFSDNGGNMYNGIPERAADGTEYVALPTSNAPLRGGKATMFEGGIRVPCVVVWPGVTAAGGRTDAMIQSPDLYPTILAMLGVPLPEGHPVDGRDIAPALRSEPWDRGAIFTYFPHAPGVPDWIPPSVAVHVGDWKLIRMFHQGDNGAHGYLLYNLKDDIGETNNLAAANPAKVAELDALIEAHLKDANTVVPVPNPAFDPSKYRPEDIGVQKGGPKMAKPSRAAPGGPAKGRRAADGWTAKGETVGLEKENDELIVHSKAGDPWIMTGAVPKLRGPVRLELEVFADTAGGMKFFAARDGKGFMPGSFVAAHAPRAKAWARLKIDIPGDGELTSLRINVPGAAGTTRLRNIRLFDAEGAEAKAW